MDFGNILDTLKGLLETILGLLPFDLSSITDLLG